MNPQNLGIIIMIALILLVEINSFARAHKYKRKSDKAISIPKLKSRK